MKKLYILAFIIFISNAISITELRAQNFQWILSKNSNGIKVYLSNSKNLEFKAFRGEVLIRASVNEGLKLIKDNSLCSEWQYKCAQIIDLNQEYILKISDIPWPLKRRYTVLKISEEKKDGRQIIFFKSVNINNLPDKVREKIPKMNDYVEIKESEGFWEILELDKNSIKVTYQMHVNPGGSLPSSIINWGVGNVPYQTLIKMREILQK